MTYSDHELEALVAELRGQQRMLQERTLQLLQRIASPFLRAGAATAHGTHTVWRTGCRCALCRQADSDAQRAYGRARAQRRLPAAMRQQLLDAIYAGRAFRTVLRDLALTSNQVWGLTKTDEEWSTALDAALTATRRDDLKHRTNAAYVAGCVCSECRDHQRVRMARDRG
jgi:hypothetical protein